jgi:peptidoglycan/LPS O-acetylase OafA/YrhL
VVRHFSRTLLTLVVIACGANLLHFAVTNPQGDMIGGWSLTPEQIRVGLTRLLYPFFAGLLLSRVCTPGRFRHAFLLSSVLVLTVLAFPRLGGSEHLWMNGLYDALAILLVFPLVVYIGASGQLQGAWATRLCRFLGDISYPVYILHYPFIYIFTAWAIDHRLTMQEAWPVALLVFVGTVVVAWASLKWYDLPLRRWLSQRFLAK